MVGLARTEEERALGTDRLTAALASIALCLPEPARACLPCSAQLSSLAHSPSSPPPTPNTKHGRTPAFPSPPLGITHYRCIAQASLKPVTAIDWKCWKWSALCNHGGTTLLADDEWHQHVLHSGFVYLPIAMSPDFQSRFFFFFLLFLCSSDLLATVVL